MKLFNCETMLSINNSTADSLHTQQNNRWSIFMKLFFGFRSKSASRCVDFCLNISSGLVKYSIP